MKKAFVSLLFLSMLLFLAHAVQGPNTETAKTSVFAQHRAKLMEKLGEGIAILTPKVWDGNDFSTRTLWSGRRHGIEAAQEVFGADAAFALDQLKELLPRYLRGKDRMFFSHREQETSPRLIFSL